MTAMSDTNPPMGSVHNENGDCSIVPVDEYAMDPETMQHAKPTTRIQTRERWAPMMKREGVLATEPEALLTNRSSSHHTSDPNTDICTHTKG